MQELLSNNIDPNDIPHRFYCGGRGVWTFQTLLAMNYYFGDKISCSFDYECDSEALNLMHNDDYGSRVKPWKGITIIARADRPPIFGPDYIIEQFPAIKETERHKFIPNWPQPGIIKRKKSTEIKRVVYLGCPDSLPSWISSDELHDQLAAFGIELRIQFDEWSDYSGVDICISYRKRHDKKLMRKPASKLINCWLGNSVMICDEEPSFKALKESEFDYLVAKDAEELFLTIMRLKEDKSLYSKMIDNSIVRSEEFKRGVIARKWFDVFSTAWEKANHSTTKKIIRFGIGKSILPLTRKM